MKRIILTGLAMILFAGFTTAIAQEPPPTTTKARTGDNPDVTYGRVKEFTAGQKIVLDVDNQVDKSFDLTDKDVKVTLAKSLKVGDPVKVTERTVNGKKVVNIAHHAGGGVKHGDKTASEEKSQSKK